MNRTEALRILGLDDDATPEDVKTAYKETVQILHPDRFASNKKLQDRATEQFKNLQEAYDYLTSGKGSRTSRSRSRAPAAERARSYTSSNQVEARMAGVAAARTQLVKQRDVALDERRNRIGHDRYRRHRGADSPAAGRSACSVSLPPCKCRRCVGHRAGRVVPENHRHAQRTYRRAQQGRAPPRRGVGRRVAAVLRRRSSLLIVPIARQRRLVARNVRNSSGKRTFRATIVLCGSGTRRRPHRKDHRRADLGMA